MLKGAPKFGLPHFPIFDKFAARIVLGILFISFFLDYQPTLAFPPVRQSTVRAQTEQNQKIDAASLPFIFQLPHPGYISTHFSSYHPGIDIAIGLGMPIHPIAKGVVLDEGFNLWGLGLIVTIDHGEGFRSLYAHMGKIYVEKGQAVEPSDMLGEVGLTGHTTGPHTHIEISKDGANINPESVLPALRQMPESQDFVAVANNNQSVTKDTKEALPTNISDTKNLTEKTNNETKKEISPLDSFIQPILLPLPQLAPKNDHTAPFPDLLAFPVNF